MILNLSTPKDMRENIEMLAHCQLKTNETLAKITEALEGLSVWMEMHEKINKENERRIALLMRAVNSNKF